MKTLITTLIILSLTSITGAQTDSLIYTKDINCELYKNQQTKDTRTGVFSLRRMLIEVDDVKSVRFFSKDSLLINSSGANIGDVKNVEFKDFSFWFVGLCVGMSLGGLTGSQIGAQYESSGGQLHLFEGVPTAIGAIIGVVAGGIVGTIIGANIYSYETLSLFKIPAKEKKDKLIKFLRENR